MDRDGRAAIDWGVYGVPETFIVDGQGIIRYKHIGPLTEEAIAGEMAREIDKAKTPLPQGGT
jgi:cytochrome c biogenesis protein CcmG/thiol:disulfide interchange protein DsbE